MINNSSNKITVNITAKTVTSAPKVAVKVTVIGAGSWGTAIANLIAHKRPNADMSGNINVTLWARRQELADEITKSHTNSAYLPDVVLSDKLLATSDIIAAVQDANAIILAVPSAALPNVAQSLKGKVPADTPVCLLTKGLADGLFSDKIGDILGNPKRISVLSGPTHAEEVAKDIYTAAVVAATENAQAQFWQVLIGGPTFRVYTTNDVAGVELLAAGKNVIALACGIVSALHPGDNTQALLMTRGLAELSRLVVAAGGNKVTAQGLAGVGDLIVTCTSKYSRNRAFGQALAKGLSLSDFEKQRGMVVEGAAAARPLLQFAQKLQVEMPICQVVCEAIDKPEAVKAIFRNLFNRPPKSEN